MPEWIQVNCLEAHPFEPGGAYVAATMYKTDDFRPYLLKTTDYGERWEKIVDGIDEGHFTRVVRADPKRQGLLYAGTESGMYISFDDGTSWKPFQLNLPIVPITDLAVKNGDLVVATQGRSFWVLDDLTPLHQLSEEAARSDFWLFEPRPAYRMRGRSEEDSKTMGRNPPNGVIIYYYLEEEQAPDALCLEILENEGTVIKSFKPEQEEKEEEDEFADLFSAVDRQKPLPNKAGMNRFVWNMRYPDAGEFEGMILWAGGTEGPRAVPGAYMVRLTVGEASFTVPFKILKDPRSTSSPEDLRAQFDFLVTVRDKLTEAHGAVERIRDVRGQVKCLLKKLKNREGAGEIEEAGNALVEKITRIEETLYQTKNRSRQDPLNFPIRLNNKLATLGNLMSMGDFRPTDQAEAVFEELEDGIDTALDELAAVMETDLPAFNRLVRNQAIPAVIVK